MGNTIKKLKLQIHKMLLCFVDKIKNFLTFEMGYFFRFHSRQIFIASNTNYVWFRIVFVSKSLVVLSLVILAMKIFLFNKKCARLGSSSKK